MIHPSPSVTNRTVAGPRAFEDRIVFMPECPLLGLQRSHLSRRGFHLTSSPSPDCNVLVFCADHLKDYPGAAALDVPKLVVGADPPAGWLVAERLQVPLLPIDLENRIVKLFRRVSVPSGPAYRLLMVEDDATVRAALEAAFEAAGFEVHSVGGFAMVQEEMNRRPDFILMDLNLPGLSGERLGEILKRQGVPIAIFSSETVERLEAARERMGAVAAFSKGTPLHEVAAQVRKHLDDLRSVAGKRPEPVKAEEARKVTEELRRITEGDHQRSATNHRESNTQMTRRTTTINEKKGKR